MRKQAIHIKSYTRSRHGRASFGGRVCSHDKSGRAHPDVVYTPQELPISVKHLSDKEFNALMRKDKDLFVKSGRTQSRADYLAGFSIDEGDMVSHPKFGKVIVDRTDYETYSVPMVIFRKDGTKMVAPEHEFTMVKPVGEILAESSYHFSLGKKSGRAVDYSNEEKFLELVKSKKYRNKPASMCASSRSEGEIDGQEMYGETPKGLFDTMSSPGTTGKVHLSYFIDESDEPDLWIDAKKLQTLLKKRAKETGVYLKERGTMP